MNGLTPSCYFLRLPCPVRGVRSAWGCGSAGLCYRDQAPPVTLRPPNNPSTRRGDAGRVGDGGGDDGGNVVAMIIVFLLQENER